jgi:DNA-binding transcriptional MerR regulator
MTQLIEKLYYSISEVAAAADVKPHVLRYWETQFKMLKPRKNRAGNRMYRPRDLQLVLTIRDLLYHNGYTIAGARRNLLDAKKAGRLVEGKLADGAAEATPSTPARGNARAEAPTEPAAAAERIEDSGDPSQLSITDVARVKALQEVRRDIEDLLDILEPTS